MKKLKQLFYLCFKFYRTLEIGLFTWQQADEMIKENIRKNPDDQWHIAPEEDDNFTVGTVWLERKHRIME